MLFFELKIFRRVMSSVHHVNLHIKMKINLTVNLLAVRCHLVCMEHDFDLSFLALLCLIAQLNTFFLKTLIVTSYKSIFHKRHAVLIRNYRKCYCWQIRDQWVGFRVQILFPHCEGYMLCWVKTVYCYFFSCKWRFSEGSCLLFTMWAYILKWK